MLTKPEIEAIVWERFERLKSEPVVRKRVTYKECPRGVVYDGPLHCPGVNINGVRVIDPHEADASAFSHDGRSCREGRSRCRRGECVDCVRVRDNLRRAIRRAVNSARPDAEVFAQAKRCPGCGVKKRGSAFGRDNGQEDALHSQCRQCNNATVTRTKLPENKRAANARRRAMKCNAPRDNHTAKQLTLHLDAMNYAGCAVCGATDTEYHLDHISPLTLGGAHALNNVQPLCSTCNLSKHNESPWTWLPKRFRELHWEPAARMIEDIAAQYADLIEADETEGRARAAQALADYEAKKTNLST